MEKFWKQPQNELEVRVSALAHFFFKNIMTLIRSKPHLDLKLVIKLGKIGKKHTETSSLLLLSFKNTLNEWL